MTKQELINEISATNGPIFSISTPENGPIFDITSATNVTWYQVNVFEVGLSDGKKPVAVKRNIDFYVKNEGEVDEAAYYKDRELSNRVNDDTSGDTSLKGIFDIYSSPLMRDRIYGAVIEECLVVFTEDPGTTNHANRVSLAVTAAKGLSDEIINMFMVIAANNSTIQENGNDVNDSTIQTLVSTKWNVIANNIYG